MSMKLYFTLLICYVPLFLMNNRQCIEGVYQQCTHNHLIIYPANNQRSTRCDIQSNHTLKDILAWKGFFCQLMHNYCLYTNCVNTCVHSTASSSKSMTGSNKSICILLHFTDINAIWELYHLIVGYHDPPIIQDCQSTVSKYGHKQELASLYFHIQR